MKLSNIIISTLLYVIAKCAAEPLEIVKQWNVANYDFPRNWPVNDKNFYDPEKIVTTGFEVGRDRYFFATPRLFSGVPATISSVSKGTAPGSPILKVKFFKRFCDTNLILEYLSSFNTNFTFFM